MSEKIPSVNKISHTLNPVSITARENLAENYLKSVFTALDTNKDGKLDKNELAGYNFGVDSLTLDTFTKKLNKAEDTPPQNVFEKMPTIAFRQNKETGEISIKEFADETFVPHTDGRKGRIWAHSSSIENIDFARDITILDKLKFTDKTFKNCNFPQNYDPQTVLEKGKNPGLNIDEIHKLTTGKGVTAIVFDNPLTPHENIDDNVVSRYDTPLSKYLTCAHQHGTSVTSVITQIVPDVKVHSLGSPCDPRVIPIEEPRMFQKALKLINSLPEQQKPKVINYSTYIQNENSQAIINKIQESGCWVLSCDEFDKNFGYLDKINPAGNPNDFENYQVASGYSPDKLYVNSGDRTLASSLDTRGYRHDSQACLSWAVPVVSGLYTAAAELKPDITPEDFIKIAKKTAYKKEITDKNELEKIAGDIVWNNTLKRLCAEKYPNLTMEQICEDRVKKCEIENEVDAYKGTQDWNDEIQKEKAKPRYIMIINAQKLMESVRRMR